MYQYPEDFGQIFSVTRPSLPDFASVVALQDDTLTMFARRNDDALRASEVS
jgi:hypothetical protein